jgi:hypothetical protein
MPALYVVLLCTYVVLLFTLCCFLRWPPACPEMRENEKMCVHARKGREACGDVEETQARSNSSSRASNVTGGRAGES